ncbi:hypothetical protein [Biostraticola tofi]|uniref:Uncharacterized protein n=1 Tax=Biostraticola tofi TaxID=466109 RepID=A0A4R3YI86_9GAMM|nr:hypothetical protein EDC52_1145 [Biostraticola tofi]
MPIVICHFHFGIMPKPDSQTAVINLSLAFEHYNQYQPPSALGYLSPREYQRRQKPSAKAGIAAWIYGVKTSVAEYLPLLAIGIITTITMKAEEPMFVAELEKRHFETAKQAGATIVFEIEFRVYTYISCQRELSAKGCVKEYGQGSLKKQSINIT